MARAYLLSQLAVQALRLAPVDFLARYPHSWLVRETGALNLPDAADTVPLTTQAPSDTVTPRARPGDSLCFQLVATEKNSGAIHIGRSRSNDVVVNDETVSRQHLVLTSRGEGEWSASSTPTSKSTAFMAKALAAGSTVRLFRGVQLKIGSIVFTFYDASGLLERLAAELKAIKR